MRKLIGLCVAIVVAGASSTTFALDIPLVDLRLGIRGGPNVNILPDVAEDDPTPVYPGFVDVGWTIGGALSFDYMSMVGITIELLHSVEPATGSVESERDIGSDGKKEESEFSMEVTSLHLPIYIRGQIPSGVARPFIHLGADFVVSRSDHSMSVTQRGDAEPYFEGCNPGGPRDDVDRCDPFPEHLYDVNPVDSSTTFLVGIGLDIDVDVVTVPIEIRALINPGFSDAIVDRTEVIDREGNSVAVYNDEWAYQVFVLFGANYVIF